MLDALEMAVTQRRPRAVIHHSDQGSQDTSLAFGSRCQEAGVRPSMGSVGDAYDNAMADVVGTRCRGFAGAASRPAPPSSSCCAARRTCASGTSPCCGLCSPA